MRALPSSTPLRLLGSLCLASIAWTACERIPIPGESTEAASDAASGTASGGDGGSGGEGVSAPIEARFSLPDSDAPDFLAVPFPSDLYKDAKGHIGAIPNLASYVLSGSSFVNAGLGQLDGFGTTAGAIFAVDDHTKEKAAPAALDAATLPATEADTTSATATVMLVDLEAASAATALVPARAEYHSDAPNGATTPPLLVIYPARGVVLAEKHRYAAVLTTGVHAKDGTPVSPSARFAAVRDGERRASPGEKLYGEAVDKIATLVPALADKSAIAAVAVYTTHGMGHELADLRAAFTKQAPPALDWKAASLAPMGAGLFANAPLAGFAATLDAWLGAPATLPDMTDDPADDQATGRAHDALAAVGTAVYNAPNLLIESAMTFNDPAHHTFSRDASGKPVVNPLKATSKIWMTIALPKGPVPPAGFPTVIVQHGINGDRSLVLSVANTFAKQGWATVGIETVTFGARASSPENIVDKKSVFPWSTGGAYAGPDGFVDLPAGATEFFGGLRSIGAVRDHMRQSVLDLGSVVDVVRNPALDLGPLLTAVPGAKLDASRVAFLGDSLGGMMGAMLAAVDPHVKTFVLNVAGGGLLLELGSSSPNIAASLSQAGAINFGFSNARFAPSHPLLQLLQHIVDPGDPLLYARNIITSPLTINGAKNPPKDVIQIEVLWDETVSNPSNEALARAAGFPLAEPNVGSMAQTPLGTAPSAGGVISGVPMAGTTAALIQAGPATHSSDLFSAKGLHHFKHPYARFDQLIPFPVLSNTFQVNQPYLALQAMMTGFFAGAFAGGGPPVIKGFPAPVLDFDGDSFPDDKDAAPEDPAVH
jgi:dienelactone hydrolase